MKAMYNCVADNPDELTFSEGEVIVVDGEEDQEWWVSICHVEDSVCKFFCASWMFARVFRFEILNILLMDVGVLCNHGGLKEFFFFF